ncbi:MAG TPA: L,D-transpeptidase [Actinomycetota bacterium]|nr:L,D-transpeptidase [Actinomycetota bacterium]
MTNKRLLRIRTFTALMLASVFFASMTGNAAAFIGSLDLSGLLGLQHSSQPPPPQVYPSSSGDLPPPPPAPAPAAGVQAPPPAVSAPAADVTAHEVPAGSGSGRRVIYAVSAQRVWLVNEDGSLHGTWRVSGRAGEPNPGSYSVFSRSRHARAKAPGITMEYMVRFVRTSGLPIGFHSIPVNRRGQQIQSVEELGTFQSLGCVRQRYEDAVTMWNFAQIGTPVIVLR